jgi:hypothetical protein
MIRVLDTKSCDQMNHLNASYSDRTSYGKIARTKKISAPHSLRQPRTPKAFGGNSFRDCFEQRKVSNSLFFSCQDQVSSGAAPKRLLDPSVDAAPDEHLRFALQDLRTVMNQFRDRYRNSSLSTRSRIAFHFLYAHA